MIVPCDVEGVRLTPSRTSEAKFDSPVKILTLLELTVTRLRGVVGVAIRAWAATLDSRRG
jgi:hypothetical protein